MAVYSNYHALSPWVFFHASLLLQDAYMGPNVARPICLQASRGKRALINRYPGKTGKTIGLGMEIRDSPKVDKYSSGGALPPLDPFLLRKGVARTECLDKEGS